MKKKLSFLLVIYMLLSLSSGFAGAIAETVERPVLTIGAAYAFRDGFWDEQVMQIVKDAVGVDIKFNYYDPDKFSLLLASNELPDIVVCSQDHLSSVLSNNMALNLDDVLDQTKFIDSEQFKARNGVMRKLLGGENNGLYFIAPGLGPERVGGGKLPSRGYTVRWDYYKEIGAPAIENDEDFLNAIEQMVAAHPATEEGATTYGIGRYNTLESFYIRACYLASVKLNPWTLSGYLYMASWDDCTLYNGYINPERSAFWTDMSFYNKLFRAGLFDMDSFTQTNEEFIIKLEAGYYVADVFNYNEMYAAQMKKNPDSMCGMVIVPSTGAGVHANKLNMVGNAPTNTIFVSANSKNQVKAVELLDYLHNPEYIRTIFSGVQGQQWDYNENGVPYLFDETISMRSENGDAWQKTGFGRSTMAHWNMAQPTARNPLDGYSYDLMEEPLYRSLALSPLYQDYCKFYDATYPSDASMKLVQAGKTFDLSGDYAQTVSAGVNNIPLDIKRTLDKCNDILYRNLAKLIMAESDEAFIALRDQIIAEIVAADEATAWEWFSAAFNEVREQIKPIYEEAYAVYEKNYLGK